MTYIVNLLASRANEPLRHDVLAVAQLFQRDLDGSRGAGRCCERRRIRGHHHRRARGHRTTDRATLMTGTLRRRRLRVARPTPASSATRLLLGARASPMRRASAGLCV
jgi:hypothetical protein